MPKNKGSFEHINKLLFGSMVCMASQLEHTPVMNVIFGSARSVLAVGAA